MEIHLELQIGRHFGQEEQALALKYLQSWCSINRYKFKSQAPSQSNYLKCYETKERSNLYKNQCDQIKIAKYL